MQQHDPLWIELPKTGYRLYVGNPLHVGVKRLHLLATLTACQAVKVAKRGACVEAKKC